MNREGIQSILSKPSLDEKDLRVISAHRHLLTDKDLVRLGFKSPPKPAPVEAPAEKEEVVEPTEAVKAAKKGKKV